jgi:hypothetical protein
MCAPWVWQARLSERIDPALGMWFDGHRESLFTLFTWAAFFLIGVLVSVPARAMRAGDGAGKLSLVLTGAGLSVALIAYLLFLHGHVLRNVYGEHALWHTSPLYVGFRGGLALAWLGLLGLCEPAILWLWRLFPALAQASGALAKQSLVAYVVHLLALYGTPFTVGLVRLGTTLSMVSAALVVLGLLALTVLCALLWNEYVASGALAREARALVWRKVDGVGEGQRFHVAAS